MPSDVLIEVRFRYIGWGAQSVQAFGLLYRFTGFNSSQRPIAYACFVDADRFDSAETPYIGILEASGETLLSLNQLGFTLGDSTTRSLRVRTQASSYRCAIDDDEATATNMSHLTGEAGLAALGAAIEVDSFIVYGPQ